MMNKNCIGLETKKLMLNVKWAARVLLEDIRANHDILVKESNKLCLTGSCQAHCIG